MFISILMYLCLVVEVICCLLLVGVILLQRSKSQGAGLAFGAGMGETLFGAQAGNVLTKTTVILAIVFLVNTTVLAMLQVKRGAATKSVADSIEPTPTQPYMPPPVEPPAAPPSGEQPAWPEATDVGDFGAGDVAVPAPAPGEAPAPAVPVEVEPPPPAEGSDAALPE